MKAKLVKENFETVWNEGKLQAFVRDLRNAGLEFSDGEAFDIADGILMDEPELIDYLASKGISDAQGWLANQF